MWSSVELAAFVIAYDRWYNGKGTNELVSGSGGSLLTTEQFLRSLPFVLVDNQTPLPSDQSKVPIWTKCGPQRDTVQVRTGSVDMPQQAKKKARVTVEFAGDGSGKSPFAIRTSGKMNVVTDTLSIETDYLSPNTFAKEKGMLDESWWQKPGPELEALLEKSRSSHQHLAGDLFREARPHLITMSVGQAGDPVWWYARRLTVSGSVACTLHAAIAQLIALNATWWTPDCKELCRQTQVLLRIDGSVLAQVDPDAPPVAVLDLSASSTWSVGVDLLPGGLVGLGWSGFLVLKLAVVSILDLTGYLI
jgi:hypothetical protein